MQKLLLIVLFIPSLCFAYGVENTWYIGVSSNGQLTTIGVRGDWDGSSPFPYGSSANPKLRYCEHALDDSFQCTSQRGENPTVIYKSGNYHYDNNAPSSDPSKGTGISHKEAMTYFKKVMAYFKRKNIKANFDSYFICDKGCNDTMPLFIFMFEDLDG